MNGDVTSIPIGGIQVKIATIVDPAANLSGTEETESDQLSDVLRLTVAPVQ
jgi:hypothetical protein